MIRPAVLALISASPAAAHGTLPGGGGFYAGAAHPFLAADHLLLLIGLGVLMGRTAARAALIPLIAALVAGFAAATLHLGPLQPAILILALVTGGLLSAAIPVSPAMLGLIAAAAGLLVGADTDGATAILAYAGVIIAACLIVLNSMALAHLGAPRLNGVPLRVAGSWIAAAAILILAFLLRGTP
jgi:hydrogenase/urease accessory protein HupE